ncbi:MAG: DNA-directed RNA polymerase subunit omega [Actinomycetes bacterium]|jgi:DNA-directed RNA polymerase subunit omega|nr:DNA-directed RNA polymerase subunit omega [Actinomycetes bacterium]
MSIVNPEIDELLDQVDSKFTLCTLAAKRSRQINDMIHGVRDQALSAMATSEIAKLTSAKPLSLAMDEVAVGDVSPESAESEGVAGSAAGDESEGKGEGEGGEDESAGSEAAVGAVGTDEELIGEDAVGPVEIPLPHQAERDALPEVDGLIG